MKEYKCEKCGDVMKDKGYSGYCHECYSEIWDSGFESTSEHAYEIGFYQLVDRLKGPCTEKAKKAIGEIMGEWGPLQWNCRKCKSILITKKDAGKMSTQSIVELLCKPCPQCCTEGSIEPKPQWDCC